MTIQQQFEALRNDHRARLGVTWSFGHQVTQHSIIALRRFPDAPKGNGAITMQEACQLADRLGIVLTLACSTPKLTAFYEALGFQVFSEVGDRGGYSVRYFRRRLTLDALVPA